VFVVFIETSDSLWIVFEQYSHALQTITPICDMQDRDNKVWLDLEHENITRKRKIRREERTLNRFGYVYFFLFLNKCSFFSK